MPSVPIDEVCVSARSGREPLEAAAAARSDPAIALARRAIVRAEPIPPVAPAALVRYVPPQPTRDPFLVRAAAAVDPADPTHAWLVVEGVTALGRPVVPLNLTVLLDLSDSMHSAPLGTLPVLQDAAPDGRSHPVDRIELAHAVLSDLVERLPTRAEWSLVVFDRTRGSTMLLPTPVTDRVAIDRALRRVSAEVARAGNRSALEEAYAVAGTSLDAAFYAAGASTDGCADTRILLITDDDARLAFDPEEVSDRVTAWADRGIELWTLSLGTSGLPSPKLDALTASGRGVVVYADTRSEAVEPVSAALRASGSAVREPAIEVAFGPGVTRWRRVGGAVGSARDAWDLPERLDAGWRDVALYELAIEPGATDLANVRFAGASPAPGEWTLDRDVPVIAGPLADADPLLRHRVFALAVGEALADPTARWADVEALGQRLVLENGAARELQGWAALLSAR